MVFNHAILTSESESSINRCLYLGGLESKSLMIQFVGPNRLSLCKDHTERLTPLWWSSPRKRVNQEMKVEVGWWKKAGKLSSLSPFKLFLRSCIYPIIFICNIFVGLSEKKLDKQQNIFCPALFFVLFLEFLHLSRTSRKIDFCQNSFDLTAADNVNFCSEYYALYWLSRLDSRWI